MSDAATGAVETTGGRDMFYARKAAAASRFRRLGLRLIAGGLSSFVVGVIAVAHLVSASSPGAPLSRVPELLVAAVLAIWLLLTAAAVLLGCALFEDSSQAQITRI
jgi:hypothetical protein